MIVMRSSAMASAWITPRAPRRPCDRNLKSSRAVPKSTAAGPSIRPKPPHVSLPLRSTRRCTTSGCGTSGTNATVRCRAFRDRRCAAFHTGPSATADIEGVLIHGAQGVRSLSVLPFALCQLYLWIFPFEVAGMAPLLAIGTLVMMKSGRRDEIITTAITTVVVMVVAAMDARHARLQPLLRLLDTVVGIAVGIGAKWVASHLFSSYARKPAQ
jgi:hypothetical protein